MGLIPAGMITLTLCFFLWIEYHYVHTINRMLPLAANW
jgi:hypothetical protein